MPLIEVAYALPQQQKILEVEVPEGTTLRNAVLLSRIKDYFPDLDVQHAALGIFGKAVKSPETETVKTGDRVEIYRPLLIDPKAIRAKRAAQNNS